jgi:hypothetical protein
MEYKEIVAVTGEAGLFQLLSSKSDGAIVRSLDGQTTKFVPSRNHNFTPLESIEVFTTGENVPLREVFKAMEEKEAGTPVLDPGADGSAIKKYFQAVFPSLDEARVYMSDLKKMLKWYPQLKAADLLKEEEPEPEATQEPAPESEAEPATPAPKKATAKKEKPAAQKADHAEKAPPKKKEAPEAKKKTAEKKTNTKKAASPKTKKGD